MTLWVKICGNTSLADAELAVEAGADALGFLFAPSPRRVTVDQAAEIIRELPKGVEKVGVFVDSNLEEIAAVVESAGLTGVQLHSAGDAQLPVLLRECFGPGLRILQVIHFADGVEEQLMGLSGNANLDGVLVDSRTADAVGGTGTRFDWQAARSGLFAAHGKVKLVAAGGLSPENVAEAIQLLRPWGVDVVSGVESSPGEKDPEKVRAFVRNARSASDTLS